MTVLLTLVTFNEPFGIGLAVAPMKVLAAANVFEAIATEWEGSFVAMAEEVEAAALLNEEDGTEETEGFEYTSVDWREAEDLAGRDVDAEVAKLEEAS